MYWISFPLATDMATLESCHLFSFAMFLRHLTESATLCRGNIVIKYSAWCLTRPTNAPTLLIKIHAYFIVIHS